MKLLDKKDVNRITKLLKHIGLPVKIEKLKLEDIMKHMKHDKKFVAEKNRFVLATKIGTVKVVAGVKAGIINAAVKACMLSE